MEARENRFLDGFSPRGRERLMSQLVYHELAAGDYLFREGDPPDGVYLVLAGEIELVKTAGDRKMVLARRVSGDFLGEVAVLDSKGRSTDARSLGTSSAALIPIGDLLEVLNKEPVSLTLRLFRNVLGLLRVTNDLYVAEVVHKEKLALVGEMAGSLMHDLRNPVQIILSAVDLIQLTHADAETEDCCEKIQVQCDRLAAMAGELLEFSRGETKLHLERTETTTLITQFQAFQEDSVHPAGLKLSIEAEPAEVEVDSIRLLRVLQNLVANATDAVNSRPGGRIDVRTWVLDSVLHLSVRDNGPGIPDAVKGRIFEPFVTGGKPGGTGLGLTIVKSIVAAHRGKITFETQAGQGTEFLVRIPQDGASRPVD